MKKIIEVSNLSKSFGELKAVDDISFSVNQGEFIAFLGENGAGKSTTINILCSILQKNSGKVFINGLDLDKDNLKIKQSVGVLFQNSVLDKKLTVKQNLFYRGSLYGLSKTEINKKIEEINSALKIDDILNRPYGKLSGGQRRRADIVRSLLNSPKVLFLDEPTTGLDPRTRLEVWESIEALQKQGMTIFLTTHYLEEVEAADNVIIIDSGKIKVTDTPHNLKNNFTSDYLILHGEETDEMDKLLESLNRKFSYNNHYKIQVENCQEAVKLINKYPKIMKDFEIINGTMDDVFLNVVGKELGAGR